MANPDEEFAVAVIKDSQIVGRTLSEILFTNHMVFCYIRGLCHLLSGIYHITGRKRKGKGLEVPCKYQLLFWIHKRPHVYLRPGIYCCNAGPPATK